MSTRLIPMPCSVTHRYRVYLSAGIQRQRIGACSTCSRFHLQRVSVSSWRPDPDSIAGTACAVRSALPASSGSGVAVVDSQSEEDDPPVAYSYVADINEEVQPSTHATWQSVEGGAVSRLEDLNSCCGHSLPPSSPTRFEVAQLVSCFPHSSCLRVIARSDLSDVTQLVRPELANALAYALLEKGPLFSSEDPLRLKTATCHAGFSSRGL